MGKKLQLMYFNANRWPYKHELCFEGTETGKEPEYAKLEVDWDEMRRVVVEDKMRPFIEEIGRSWSEITKGIVQKSGKSYWGQFK
jgi:hypothetical protein